MTLNEYRNSVIQDNLKKITHRAAERNLSWCEWAEHRLNFCRNVAQSANFLRVPSTGVARRADDETAIVLHGVDQN